MQRVAQQRRAQNVLHLLFAQALVQRGYGLQVEFVALHDGELVGGEAGEAFGAARGQTDAGGQGQINGFIHKHAFQDKSRTARLSDLKVGKCLKNAYYNGC